MAINTARNFFSEKEQNTIIQTIKEVELKTSSELRVHIDSNTKISALDRAAQLFRILKMHKTKERNGVLIYMAVENKLFAIIGDAGIHQYVKEQFWQECKEETLSKFKEGNFCSGIVDCIKKVGVELEKYFPYQTDDKNELPDEISFN